MNDCPGALTWQAVVDGEENNPALLEHLDQCPACRAVYQEISATAGLAGALATEAALPPAVARRILRQANFSAAWWRRCCFACWPVQPSAASGFGWWFRWVVRLCSLI